METYMEQGPSFYLASAESIPTLAPRECFIEERLAVEGRDDYLRVRIEPPIIGQPYGLEDKDIEDVVLATRWKGATLHPVGKWPMHVFVCRIIDEEIRGSGKASPGDLEVILIGDLCPTRDEAVRSVKYLEDLHYPIM
jgi:hypothetical protein